MNLKNILFLLLIISLGRLYGQTGTYRLQADFMSSSYTFSSNNKFEYTEITCVGKIVGKGKYKISHDQISFYYEPNNALPNTFCEPQKGVATFRLMGKIGARMILSDSANTYILDYHKVEKENAKTGENLNEEMDYAYPNYFEQAFQDGYTLVEEADHYTFTKVNIGNLKVTSGKIIACDPIVLHDAEPFKYDFPIGEFPVEIAMSKINGRNPRNALVRILFSKNKIHKWEFALHKTQEYLKIDSGSFYGYPVDGATGLYIDQQGANYLNALDQDDWFEEIFVNEFSSSTTNAPRFLVHDFEKFNLATFESGYGDGFYAVYIGLDKEGNICQLLTDFAIIDWWD